MPETTLRRGKQPHTDDRRDLEIADLGLALDDIAVPAGDFGNYPLLFGKTEPDESMFYDFTFPLGMYGNDRVGDCVPAWFAHGETLDSLEGDHPPLPFSADAVVTDYSTVTGYKAGHASTDRGTEIRAYLNYHRRTGILDANGRRRRIGAYAAFAAGDLDKLLAVVYALGKVSIGMLCAQWAMEEFNAKHPFAISGDPEEDGHCVGIVGRYQGKLVVETWGTLALMEPAFYERENDESWGYFSSEMLSDGRTISGLDKEKALAVVGELN